MFPCPNLYIVTFIYVCHWICHAFKKKGRYITLADIAQMVEQLIRNE
ncbi:MAG: hypothetical protein JWQ66_742 [Mucilaginibacter sp.]|nr:hypothetical protein [Mucilaginibacter sp.]